MKILYSIIPALFLLILAELGFAVPLPIEFNTPTGVTLIKRLNHSLEFPIVLYRSTPTVGGAADNTQNKYFGARTIARLETTGLSDSDKKRVRNEICASNRIYTTGAAVPLNQLSGSLGVYLNGDSIVGVSDTGITGERLDSVLRKLNQADSATKSAWAKYYAVAMTKALENIHAANVIWNNVDLHNFYARPDGGLYAADFSDAKLSTGQPDKDKEFDNLVTNAVQKMYQILFPQANEASAEYNLLLKLGSVSAALARIPGVPDPALGNEFTQAAVQLVIPGLSIAAAGAAAGGVPAGPKAGVIDAAAALIVVALIPADLAVLAKLSPIRTPYTQALFIRELERELPGNSDAVGLAGGLGDTIVAALGPGYAAQATTFLNAASHIPFPGITILPSIANNEQQAADVPNSILATDMYFDRLAITPLIPVVGAAANAYTPAFCATWTGNE